MQLAAKIGSRVALQDLKRKAGLAFLTQGGPKDIWLAYHHHIAQLPELYRPRTQAGGVLLGHMTFRMKSAFPILPPTCK